ncbi:MAG: trypsin-like peptidase domain-containing protein [Roseinatronobacter sp.]
MTFGSGHWKGMASALALICAAPASAQDTRWVQVEAHRDLETALDRAATLQAQLGNVSGFVLPSTWHALSIGPFESETDAFAVRRQLRAERAIPADAFVSNGADYGVQFFPVPGGAILPPSAPQTLPEPEPDSAPLAALSDTVTAPPALAAPITAPIPDLVPELAPEIAQEPEPEETLREAQANERTLTREERAEIQTALQWFGHYALTIDAAFGPGTRRAISAWQAAEGVDQTGVLTTRQRAALIEGWQGELASLGMKRWDDDLAGISIELPLAMLEFDRHETPFAHFREKDNSGVRALLISQPGTQATLFGLYEIMQTLDIVPLEGARERRQNSFLLTGQSDTLRSHTFAALRDGTVKGFTLIWTPERDAQMARVLPMMETSFTPMPGSLPESAGQPSTVARGDLLAGLNVRRPDFSRSGFFIDAAGTVLTQSETVAQCTRITIDETYDARLHALDPVLGLAILKPETPLVPMDFAQFENSASRPGSEVTISGFSFEDVMTRPVLTFGRLEGLNGVGGELDRLRLSATVRQGDLGGPVFGPNGAVIGLLEGAPREDGRLLPPDVTHAVSAQAIRDFLTASNITSDTSQANGVVPPERLTRVAGDLTVLISCWN